MTDFTELMGKTLASVTGEVGDEEMVFTTTDGTSYQLWHEQYCCESVVIEDIVGDLTALVGSPITQAEEVTHLIGVTPKDLPSPPTPEYGWVESSFTWTFYKLATAKGHVTIRWYGESNGRYSESVDFEEIVAE